MLSEFLDNLATRLKPAPLVEGVDGVEYAIKQTEYGPEIGLPILPLIAPTLTLNSLSGFVAAYGADIDTFSDGPFAVHVADYKTVRLVSLRADSYGRRHVWMEAVNTEANPFPFDEYQVPERFLINLQSGFLPTDNVVALQRLASSLSAGQSITTQDDGFSQSVVVNSGAVSAQNIAIPPRLSLVAYRSFRELDPVASDFLVRLKGKAGELPTIALLQVDAGRWKHDTQLMIQNWLAAKLPEAVIIA